MKKLEKRLSHKPKKKSAESQTEFSEKFSPSVTTSIASISTFDSISSTSFSDLNFSDTNKSPVTKDASYEDHINQTCEDSFSEFDMKALEEENKPEAVTLTKSNISTSFYTADITTYPSMVTHWVANPSLITLKDDAKLVAMMVDANKMLQTFLLTMRGTRENQRN